MSSVDSFSSGSAANGHVPLPGRSPAPNQAAASSSVGGGDASLVQEMKNEIRTLVQEITQLSQADISDDDFYAGFVTRVVSAMAAIGGAVWTLDGKQFTLAYQANLMQAGVQRETLGSTQHQRLLERVAESQQALIVPPRSGAAGSGAASEDDVANPSDQLLVVSPLLVEGKVHGVLEVFQRPGGGPTTQRGYLRFVVQMADLAADFLKNRRLRYLNDRQELWRQLEQFLNAIHSSLDLSQTSYTLVNEARRLLGCDRVSLALAAGRKTRIEAVSGLDSIERRAAQVQRLQQLSTAVAKTRQPFWHEAGGADLPPQIERPLQEYVDLSHARMIGVLPLFAPTAKSSTTVSEVAGHAENGRLLGTLIIEQLHDDQAGATLRGRAEMVAQHGAAAIANADRYSSLFLLPLWQTLGSCSRWFRGWALVRFLTIVVLLAAGCMALAVVQTDFEVAAHGKLQPSERRDVFAGIDGIVSQVHARHGQQVVPGATLVELQNSDLEQQIAAVIGKQNTTQEQIAALQRAMLDTARGNAREDDAEESRIAGQLLELRQESENLQRELELHQLKQRELTVVAQQAGQVVTWKVDELLLRRPVQRGQVLLTIANPQGAWELELYVPERRMKHLADAIAAMPPAGSASPDAPQPLDVVFMLSSHPGEQFHGRIVEIEQTAEVRGEDGNAVLVRVAIDKAQLPPLHDQVTVTAKIYVGRASVGYVWFCDLIEAAQAKVLFWL